MRKHWLIVIIASLLAMAGLSACGDNADATIETTSCDGDVAAKIVDKEAEFADAQSDAKDSKGTPAGDAAKDRADELEDQLTVLNECDKAPAESSTSTTVADDCAEGHDVRLPDRTGGRLNADGATTRGDGEAFRAQIANQAAHDPLTLFLYYQASPLGEKNPLPNAEVLVEGNVIEAGKCYSEEGIRAYDEWYTLWKYTDITPVEQVSSTGHNTGVNGTQPTTSSGVGGDDQAGVDVSYKDATGKVVTEHSALYRCTQPTSGAPIPGVPPGPTDNPPGTPPSSPPPSGGKDHRKSPVSSDRNHPDERVRPNIPAPPEVIRPPGAEPTQPAPQPTLPVDPPQVIAPEPIAPGVPNLPPTPVDPVEAPGADTDGDGIPD